jgi:YhcH/YjgK/YiaL family protein
MIFDTLKNKDRYTALHPRFREAFDFIEAAVGGSFPVGTYELSGKDLYASVQEYTTKQADEGMFEGHESYIDIQYLVSGLEAVDMAEKTGMLVKIPYDSDRDVEFYEDTDKAMHALLEAGSYGIFYPNDIHKPGLAFAGIPVKVKKIVVKIRL